MYILTYIHVYVYVLVHYWGMAIATDPVGSSFNQTNFQMDYAYSLITIHLIDYCTDTYTCRRGRHVFNIALMAAKQSLPMLLDEPHHPKPGCAFSKQSFGNQNWYCALRRPNGSVAGHSSTMMRSRCCVLPYECYDVQVRNQQCCQCIHKPKPDFRALVLTNNSFLGGLGEEGFFQLGRCDHMVFMNYSCPNVMQKQSRLL